ncbi:MAG: peptidoglycan DD-metalloendopeptidase family protein [Chloroflexi bacterium]|nr:peptidoglycan DD-metalloendopeptidase family protein [Chloroflexota bacterium]
MLPRTADSRGWSRPRRRVGRGFFSFLLLVTVLGGFFVAPTPTITRADDLADAVAKQKALASQIAKQKAQVAALTQSQASLSTELASTKRSLASINADLTAVRSNVVQMTVDVAVAQGQVDELDAVVSQLDLQLRDLQDQEAAKLAQLNERKAVLAARIRLAYDSDRTTVLETMLSSGTFTDVLNDVSYQLDFAEQDRLLAEQIVADQKVLTVLRASVETTRSQTKEMKAAADARRAELGVQLKELAATRDKLARLEAETKRLLAAQQAAFARMSANKAALATSIAASEKADRALQATIDRLIAEQSRQGGIPSQYSGTLSWPLGGTVTQWFGCTGFEWEPPKGDCAHFHSGIDIAAPMYTPIRAAGAGVVVFAGPNPYDAYPKAWIVIIAHSNNLSTWYAHIDDVTRPPAVVKGQRVEAGQVIAYVGTTGRSTGPHLHWGVVSNGDFVDPRLFL